MTKKIAVEIKKNKTIYLQSLFVVLSFAAMSLLSYVFMSSIVRDSMARRAELLIDMTESNIDSRVEGFRSRVEGFAEGMESMLTEKKSIADIEEYIESISAFTRLNSSGSVGILSFYGYFEYQGGEPVMVYADDYVFPENVAAEETEWYKLAVDSDELVETIPYIAESGQRIFTYAKAIHDGSGNRIGIVCMDVDITNIGSQVVTIALNQGGHGMLLAQNFVTLFHPNKPFEGQNINSDIPYYKFIDNFIEGRDVVEQPLVAFDGEDSVAFFRVMSNGWILGIVTPEAQYYKSTVEMGFILVGLAALFGVILISIMVRLHMARVKSDDENKKKSMFLANMSHEIRTPINAIVGMTAIGQVAGTNERKDYCFSKIDIASKHLLGVVNDILDMSKIEADKIEISPVDFNFEKLLQRVVNVINFRVEEKKQNLTVDIDKMIPKVLFADDQRVAQIITNLLSNAVKFTPDEGSIKLTTKLLEEQDGICTVQIDVTDSGIGISEEQQRNLFQIFQQAESSTTRRFGGTGLGLAISRKLVEMMGGKIWITSSLGKGSTFSFTIKARRGEEKEHRLSSHNVNFENVQILTVDNDPYVLEYFKEIVTSLGANCDLADGAVSALKMIEEKSGYNIYFVDLNMPGIDGIALTKEIRAREKTPGSSIVIMLSSADLSSVENDARKAGVDRFLVKPLFPSSIADIISECIGISAEQKAKTERDINGIFAGHKVLFVEDIDINREIVITLLEPTQIDIDCAENGVEAVKMFYESPGKYEMIFMDIQMPLMDGYEATRQIRSLGVAQAKTIPIVAMTANVFREDVEACLEAGMNSHLGKPLDINDLIDTAIKYLGNELLTATKKV